MRYYVVADIHGFYTKLIQVLNKAEFFTDPEPHKLIVLGDIMDRGEEACKMQDFILERMKEDDIILIRGNHEDLYEALITVDEGRPYSSHIHNGTFETALQLTGFDVSSAVRRNFDFCEAGKNTPYFKEIIPAMTDYFETDHYVFVHGWIPCEENNKEYTPVPDWRNASPKDWKKARWYNGMDAAQTADEEKTVICGHWHTSYGHFKYENKGSEFGKDADFSPYYAPHVIAIDACTAFSGKVNCLVLED